MPDFVRCECGNEVRSLGLSPVSLRCALCGRRPPVSVAIVNRDVGPFATLLVVLALISAVPAAWVMGEALTQPRADGPHLSVPVWAYLTVFAAIVQIAYSVYLLQFPHWISLQAVAVASLFWGAIAAIALGGTLVGGASGWAGTLLQLGDALPAVRGPKVSGASLWCLLLTVAWTAFSIWCGWRAQMARAQLRRILEPVPLRASAAPRM